MLARRTPPIWWSIVALAVSVLLLAVLTVALSTRLVAASALNQVSTSTPTPRPGTGSIAGNTWDDKNGDGVRGSSEPPLAGVTVTAQAAGGPVSALSDTNGDYRLVGLVPGIYTVTARPPVGYELTTQATYNVFVSDGGTLALDFGAYAPPTPTPTATLQPALDASGAETVYCGGIYHGDTQTGKSNVSRYSCQPGWNESGPEVVYRVEVAAAQPFSMTLLHAAADLDLFLTRYVFPESCVAAGDNFLTYQAEPGVYLLAVDGYEGSAGPFTLRVDCPLGEQATATPTFTPSPRPTATVTPTPGPTYTPSATPRPQKVYLPSILRNYPYVPPNLTTVTLQAGVNGYQGATDTTLDSWEPGVSQGTDRDLRLFYSRTQAANTSKAPVLRFSMAFLPSSALVQRAELRLYVPLGPDNDLRAQVRGVLRPWSEADATWHDATAGQPWSQPGAQAVNIDHSVWAGTAQQIHAGGQWYTFDITPLAAGWVRDPGQNYGMILFALAGNSDANVEARFASREYDDPALRPQLVITYGVP